MNIAAQATRNPIFENLHSAFSTQSWGENRGSLRQIGMSGIGWGGREARLSPRSPSSPGSERQVLPLVNADNTDRKEPEVGVELAEVHAKLG